MTRAVQALAGAFFVTLTACSSSTSIAGSHASAGRTTPDPVASYARTQPGSPAPADLAGSISGNLLFPADFLPAEAVYAVSVDGSHFYVDESAAGQVHYTMLGLPAGDYYVLATLRVPVYSGGDGNLSGGGRFGGAYTRSVPCGLSVACTDHTLVSAHVSAGRDTSHIDPVDWYADYGAYPLVPQGGPSGLTLPKPPATFSTSLDAAVSEAQFATGSRYVPLPGDCGTNAACTWLASPQPGQDAAYYTGGTGSNSDVQACAFYVVGSDAAGWRTFDSRCRSASGPFPARGETGSVTLGMGETGCVNVHAEPATTARVVACLAGGTSVRIDDGPVYTGETTVASGARSAVDFWWHIAGRGWMVHQYLRDG